MTDHLVDCVGVGVGVDTNRRFDCLYSVGLGLGRHRPLILCVGYGWI